jgi:hypothetical protein
MRVGPTFQVQENIHMVYAGDEVKVAINTEVAGIVYLVIAPAARIGVPAMEHAFVLENLEFERGGEQTVAYTVPKLLVGMAYELVAIQIARDIDDVRITPQQTLLIAADQADGAARLARNWDLAGDELAPTPVTN